MPDVLLQQREDHVAILTLNRPDTLNALDTELMRDLLDAVTSVAEDDDVHCVVVTGAGRGFCSGGDMRASGSAADAIARDPANEDSDNREATIDRRSAWLRKSVEATRLLHDMRKPTIAMVNGACAGAGLSIAGACDLRFAAESSKFVSAFTPIGLSGDYGGTWYWTQILGTARARELYFLSDRYNAAEALAFGLVNRVYPDERLREATLAVAHRLASMPRGGLAYAKDNLNAAIAEELSPSLDRESRNLMLARQELIEASRANDIKQSNG